ncbi:MAG: hypothetical protein IJ065_02470 [Eubacterium sp.]|nr:hypothetical protein [Eubacterium sp.]
MFRVLNEYIGRLTLQLDENLIHRVEEVIMKDKSTNTVNINVSFNKYIVDVRMKEFSVEEADRAFRQLECSVAYPYSHISARFNESTRVKYRFATCKEDKTGIYMDVVYS